MLESSFAIEKVLLVQVLWATQVEHEQILTKKLLSHPMIMEIAQSVQGHLWSLIKMHELNNVVVVVVDVVSDLLLIKYMGKERKV